MSEIEKSIIDFLKKCKENKDKVIPLLQQSNEILLNYIDKLNNQLQQKDKEIERLKELCDKYEEEHKTTFEEWKKNINIIKEVREYIEEHSQMTDLQIYGIENVLSFRGSVEELLEILDKVEE